MASPSPSASASSPSPNYRPSLLPLRSSGPHTSERRSSGSARPQRRPNSRERTGSQPGPSSPSVGRQSTHTHSQRAAFRSSTSPRGRMHGQHADPLMTNPSPRPRGPVGEHYSRTMSVPVSDKVPAPPLKASAVLKKSSTEATDAQKQTDEYPLYSETYWLKAAGGHQPVEFDRTVVQLTELGPTQFMSSTARHHYIYRDGFPLGGAKVAYLLSNSPRTAAHTKQPSEGISDPQHIHVFDTDSGGQLETILSISLVDKEGRQCVPLIAGWSCANASTTATGNASSSTGAAAPQQDPVDQHVVDTGKDNTILTCGCVVTETDLWLGTAGGTILVLDNILTTVYETAAKVVSSKGDIALLSLLPSCALARHRSTVTALVFSQPYGFVYSASLDFRIIQWSASERCPLQCYGEGVKAVSAGVKGLFLMDDGWGPLVSFSADCCVRCWGPSIGSGTASGTICSSGTGGEPKQEGSESESCHDGGGGGNHHTVAVAVGEWSLRSEVTCVCATRTQIWVGTRAGEVLVINPFHQGERNGEEKDREIRRELLLVWSAPNNNNTQVRALVRCDDTMWTLLSDGTALVFRADDIISPQNGAVLLQQVACCAQSTSTSGTSSRCAPTTTDGCATLLLKKVRSATEHTVWSMNPKEGTLHRFAVQSVLSPLRNTQQSAQGLESVVRDPLTHYRLRYGSALAHAEQTASALADENTKLLAATTEQEHEVNALKAAYQQLHAKYEHLSRERRLSSPSGDDSLLTCGGEDGTSGSGGTGTPGAAPLHHPAAGAGGGGRYGPSLLMSRRDREILKDMERSRALAIKAKDIAEYNLRQSETAHQERLKVHEEMILSLQEKNEQLEAEASSLRDSIVQGQRQQQILLDRLDAVDTQSQRQTEQVGEMVSHGEYDEKVAEFEREIDGLLGQLEATQNESEKHRTEHMNLRNNLKRKYVPRESVSRFNTELLTQMDAASHALNRVVSEGGVVRPAHQKHLGTCLAQLGAASSALRQWTNRCQVEVSSVAEEELPQSEAQEGEGVQEQGEREVVRVVVEQLSPSPPVSCHSASPHDSPQVGSHSQSQQQQPPPGEQGDPAYFEEF